MDTASLLNLRKFLAPEIVYGEGAISLSGRHATNFGASRVCIVTDPGIQKAGWTSVVEDSLKQAAVPYAIFNRVTPNPKDHEVMAGAQFCKANGCDLIIAVGGGSSMDCAKGVGVVMGNPGSILEYEGVDMVPNPGPPLIFIPTTAGSSADISQFAIITDTVRNVKITIISKMVVPDIALIDPATTATMSAELTAATGMDALSHAFEAFVSTASSPLTDMAAISAVTLIFDNLLNAYLNPHHPTYRDKMMTASLMAGLAFSNASLGLVHAMAHSLGGTLGLPHGECNALLLEKVVQFNYSHSPEKYNLLAKAIHLNIDEIAPAQRGAAICDQIAWLRQNLNIDQRLVDLGVHASDIPRLSEFALIDPCLATNPREANKKEIEDLYLQIHR
jgi:alcohol dehydrogenase class IV